MDNNEIIESCKFYENCDAQLYPLDKTIGDKVWYADEDVCCSGKFKHFDWIKRQKSLRKRKGTVEQGLFTVAMLSSIGRITTKTKGVNPDKKKTVATWVAQKIHKKQLLLKTNA